MGAIFRLSDAFGITEIIFAGNSPQINGGRFKSAARSAEKYVRFSKSENSLQTLEQLHSSGYLSIALEITDVSIPLQQLSVSSQKLVLIIGNESQGVSSELLEKVHHQAHINMFGNNSSMNVAQATAIAFYELTRQ